MKPKFSYFQFQRKRNANRHLPIEREDNSREGKLKRVAHQLSMNFSPIEEYSTKPYLTEFNLFKMGRNRRITNILKKTDEIFDTKLQIFDYEFDVSYGKNRRKYKQSVFFVQSKQLALPEFAMEPESIFHKISSYLFGSQDIDFEDYPKFSRNYLLTGDDEEYIRFMLNPDLLQYFGGQSGWYMEGINFYLILYKLNQRFSPKSIGEFYRQGHAVYRSMAEEMKWDPIL